ncbi:MAG TPA: hypothetical protein VFV93_03710, partial [Thermomicrobiales bacterium]|nr:hypothetical protein [Thermomicrobiales bacterium]
RNAPTPNRWAGHMSVPIRATPRNVGATGGSDPVSPESRKRGNHSSPASVYLPIGFEVPDAKGKHE